MVEQGILIAYIFLGTMAFIPIWVGSRLSLDKSVDANTMSKKDAMMFPIIGSCVLFGLFVLFKFVAKEYINLVMSTYFTSLGVMALHGTLRPLMARVLGETPSTAVSRFALTIPFYGVWHVEWTFVDLPTMALACAIGLWYAFSRHWVANNLLGFCFSLQGVSLISVGSFQVGAMLLGGLFFYDIFWVFGTPVMVTVAKSFDAPIKLVFPKDLWAEEYAFSMLGLGDIVIPGMFIALLLRYDRYMLPRRQGARAAASDKPFFLVNFVAYVVSLVTTIVIMHITQAGQPALLYIVPGCLGAAVVQAMVMRELDDLMNFDEEAVAKLKEREAKRAKAKKK